MFLFLEHMCNEHISPTPPSQVLALSWNCYMWLCFPYDVKFVLLQMQFKLEEIQARQHMQHETNYHTVNLEQAPVMLV